MTTPNSPDTRYTDQPGNNETSSSIDLVSRVTRKRQTQTNTTFCPEHNYPDLSQVVHIFISSKSFRLLWQRVSVKENARIQNICHVYSFALVSKHLLRPCRRRAEIPVYSSLRTYPLIISTAKSAIEIPQHVVLYRGTYHTASCILPQPINLYRRELSPTNC